MRIVHLVGRSHRRGAEQVAVELAGELDRNGHADRLVAVSAGHEGDRVPELVPLVDQHRQGPRQLLVAARHLRRDLRREPADVILAHGAAAAMVAALAAPRRGPALVFQTIMGMADRSFAGIERRAWGLVLRRVDAVVALTPAMGEELVRLGYRGPIWDLPNARRADRFEGLDRTEAAGRLRAELRVRTETFLVGLVGYLVDQKQPLHAVAAIAALRDAGVDAHLVIAGGGPLGPAVAEAVRAGGLDDRVSLLGHRDDVAQVLGGLDVLVLTSSDEGVPGILVEAAMAGCPVVTYPVGGVAAVVEHDVTGLVVAGADVDHLVAGVRDLQAAPERLAAMSAAARRASAAFTLERVARRYEERLSALTGTSVGAG